MPLHLFLRPELIRAELTVANRRALFIELGRMAATIGLDAAAVTKALGAREREGSTGFGGGVAIPHARIEGLEAPVGMVVRLVPPVDVQAVDGQPVDVVLALLSPVDAAGEHLRALAGLSRVARSAAMLDKLRGARSRDALVALLMAEDERDAA